MALPWCDTECAAGPANCWWSVLAGQPRPSSNSLTQEDVAAASPPGAKADLRPRRDAGTAGWVLNAPGPVEEIALHGDRLVVEGKKVIARTAEGSCPDQRFRKGLLKSLSSHAAAPSRTARKAYGDGLLRMPKSPAEFGLGSGKMSGGCHRRYFEALLNFLRSCQAVASACQVDVHQHEIWMFASDHVQRCHRVCTALRAISDPDAGPDPAAQLWTVMGLADGPAQRLVERTWHWNNLGCSIQKYTQLYASPNPKSVAYSQIIGSD